MLLLACHQTCNLFFPLNCLHSSFSLLWCKPEFVEAGFTACRISEAAFSMDISLFSWLNATPAIYNLFRDPLVILCVCCLSRQRKGKKSFCLNLLGSCKGEPSSHRYQKYWLLVLAQLQKSFKIFTFLKIIQYQKEEFWDACNWHFQGLKNK